MIRPLSIRGVSVTFHGAVQTVTGSMHRVETAHARVLLDCYPCFYGAAIALY